MQLFVLSLVVGGPRRLGRSKSDRLRMTFELETPVVYCGYKPQAKILSQAYAGHTNCTDETCKVETVFTVCSYLYIFYLNKLAPEDCHTWHETPCSAFVAKNKFYIYICIYLHSCICVTNCDLCADIHYVFWAI